MSFLCLTQPDPHDLQLLCPALPRPEWTCLVTSESTMEGARRPRLHLRLEWSSPAFVWIRRLRRATGLSELTNWAAFRKRWNYLLGSLIVKVASVPDRLQDSRPLFARCSFGVRTRASQTPAVYSAPNRRTSA